MLDIGLFFVLCTIIPFVIVAIIEHIEANKADSMIVPFKGGNDNKKQYVKFISYKL